HCWWRSRPRPNCRRPLRWTSRRPWPPRPRRPGRPGPAGGAASLEPGRPPGRARAAEAARAGATVAGGDTASFEAVLLAVTGLGDLQGRAPVTRGGARPGDVVSLGGPL